MLMCLNHWSLNNISKFWVFVIWVHHSFVLFNFCFCIFMRRCEPSRAGREPNANHYLWFFGISANHPLHSKWILFGGCFCVAGDKLHLQFCHLSSSPISFGLSDNQIFLAGYELSNCLRVRFSYLETNLIHNVWQWDSRSSISTTFHRNL